jgi:tetratricopeptide (TPR) repeat protein
MARDDWYRRTSWTDEDQVAFHQRLKRSRGNGSKAQYARIQANHLFATGIAELIVEADKLLDLVLEKFPERSELAQAYLQKAECALALIGTEQAFWWFRKALQAEREYPNVRTNAYSRFAELVASEGRADLYDEALAVLHENRNLRLFPVDRYIFHGVHAVILSDRGKRDDARKHAELALAAASATTSGITRHANVGLVRDRGTSLHSQISALAGT